MAKFVAKLTDLPLITKIEELEIDDKLVEVVGDAVIRREGIFPHQRLSPNSVAAVMINPARLRKTGIVHPDHRVESRRGARGFRDAFRDAAQKTF